MAGPSAGKAALVSVSTDDAAWNAVGGLNNVDLDFGNDTGDVTKFGDTAKGELPTLGTFSGSGAGYYDYSDVGQAAIVAAIDAGTKLYVKALVDGTHGRKGLCLVKAKVGAKASDVVNFSFTFELAGGAKSVAI
jgi:hypothetical protein